MEAHSPPEAFEHAAHFDVAAVRSAMPNAYSACCDAQENEADEREEEWLDTEPDIGNFTKILQKPPLYDEHGNSILVIVDVTGIHYVSLQKCPCSANTPLFHQLLDYGWYPATTDKPRTVFTFDVLDDFLIHNKECHTSISSYHARLRRATSEAFPHLVLVSIIHRSSKK